MKFRILDLESKDLIYDGKRIEYHADHKLQKRDYEAKMLTIKSFDRLHEILSCLVKPTPISKQIDCPVVAYEPYVNISYIPCYKTYVSSFTKHFILNNTRDKFLAFPAMVFDSILSRNKVKYALNYLMLGHSIEVKIVIPGKICSLDYNQYKDQYFVTVTYFDEIDKDKEFCDYHCHISVYTIDLRQILLFGDKVKFTHKQEENKNYIIAHICTNVCTIFRKNTEIEVRCLDYCPNSHLHDVIVDVDYKLVVLTEEMSEVFTHTLMNRVGMAFCGKHLIFSNLFGSVAKSEMYHTGLHCRFNTFRQYIETKLIGLHGKQIFPVVQAVENEVAEFDIDFDESDEELELGPQGLIQLFQDEFHDIREIPHFTTDYHKLVVTMHRHGAKDSLYYYINIKHSDIIEDFRKNQRKNSPRVLHFSGLHQIGSSIFYCLK